ncbi:MAG: hypothetical protein P8J33_05495 [Pirellulaceae bacterium]|nr:hypothetical protein [Pirellulaceae bacterium]
MPEILIDPLMPAGCPVAPETVCKNWFVAVAGDADLIDNTWKGYSGGGGKYVWCDI